VLIGSILGIGGVLKTDRTGLVIVVASLLAITVIVALVFKDKHNDRLSDIRGQGVTLARALSGVAYEQLIPGGEQSGVIRVLRHTNSNSDFAYATIVDPAGGTITEVVADGLIVPLAEMPDEPAAWLGEQLLESVPGKHQVIEFHAPLLSNGQLQGFIRLGYFYPSIIPKPDQVSYLATMALPVFLLAPFFYFLLRREVRPIRAANEEMSKIMDGEAFSRVEVAASGELGDFMRRFNQFMAGTAKRIDELEEEQERLVTSSKLLTYRKYRVESVLETLPEAVMILDEAGSITFANQKLAALFGATQQVIVTQPPQSWCEHPDVLSLLAKFQTDGNKKNFTDTIRFDFRVASEKAIATKTYPLFSPGKDSSSMGTLIVFRDETQEALARQARSDFVGHLSHELKSPLNVLALYSELLLSEAGKSEERRIEAANVIADEVRQLAALISSLLSMTQIENGSLTPEKSLVKLNDVVAAAMEEARHLTNDRSLAFEIHAPREMNPVMIDKDQIRIAISNLLSNAVKYNRDGGRVELTIEETEDAIQIRVADTGIGVSEEEASSIFEKFYRSDSDEVQAASGHGLGLALARQIVELHGGTLSLNRDREEGAEFIINLWKEASAARQAI
jgi:signal transduction histidine kinase